MHCEYVIIFEENNTTCTFIVYAFQGLSKITEDGVHSCVVGTWKQLQLHRFREMHWEMASIETTVFVK